MKAISPDPDRKASTFEKLAAFISAARDVGDSQLKFSESQCLLPRFSSARGFFVVAKSANIAIKAGIDQITMKVGSSVDPLYLPWDRHRQLDSLNENAFSDWLAWTLEIVQTEKAALGELIFQLFPPDGDKFAKPPKGVARIHRETVVEHGHEGQEGRTDLIIDFMEDSIVWHVEVKVTPAETADLEKNLGYSKALGKIYQKKVNNFILVTSAGRNIYHLWKGDFQAVTWNQLSQRLRRWVLKSGNLRFAEYQCMMFCGLVEYHLLKICPGSFKHLNFLIDTYRE